MDAETIHFVLELFVGLITLGVGGLFTWLLRMESRIIKIETKIEKLVKTEEEVEYLSQVLVWYTKKREND